MVNNHKETPEQGETLRRYVVISATSVNFEGAATFVIKSGLGGTERINLSNKVEDDQ